MSNYKVRMKLNSSVSAFIFMKTQKKTKTQKKKRRRKKTQTKKKMQKKKKNEDA